VRSLWCDAMAVCDAAVLHIWTGDAARVCGGEPALVVDHAGAPVNALAGWLGSAPRQRWSVQNRVHMVIAHPWTHSVVVPWQDGLFSATAWEAYAHALFAARAIRGPLRVRVEDSCFGQSRLGVAISTDFIGKLKEACNAAGWRLASCRDAFSVALQTHATRLDDSECRFVLLQKSVMTCAFRRRGEWAEVITLSRNAQQRLDDLLAAAALMTAQSMSDAVYVSASERQEAVAGAENVIWLDACTAPKDQQYVSEDAA